MIKHEIIGLYVTLNGKNRIDFLISHYRDFENFISSYKDYVYDTMLDILSSSHCSSDDLGVRVQTSNGNSDPTYKGALGRLSIDDCFYDEDLIENLFSDSYENELVKTGLYEWKRLQREFKKLNSSMAVVLNQEEQGILKSYFTREKNLQDIAEEYCIEIESANKKVYRIRKKLVKSIEPWFDKYNLNASA